MTRSSRGGSIHKRSPEHTIADRAIRIFKSVLPSGWIVREQRSDYGVNCEIELAGFSPIVTRPIIKCRVHASAAPTPAPVTVPTRIVRYWCVLSVPVIIVRVIGRDRVFWLNVRDYLHESGALDDLMRIHEATISFSFRRAHELPETHGTLRDLALHRIRDLAWMRQELDSDLRQYFIAINLLIYVFDGDTEAWIHYLQKEETAKQLAGDLPIPMRIVNHLRDDPEVRERMCRMVEHFNADPAWRLRIRRMLGEKESHKQSRRGAV